MAVIGTFVGAIGLLIIGVCAVWMFFASFASEMDVRMLSTQTGDGMLPKYDPETVREVRKLNAPNVRRVRLIATPWMIVGAGLFLLGLYMRS